MLNSGDWIDVDMIVQFRDNYDEELRGKEGTVKSIVKAVSVETFEMTGFYFFKMCPSGSRVMVLLPSVCGRLHFLSGELRLEDNFFCSKVGFSIRPFLS